MRDVNIIEPSLFTSMPWRNGKGSTIELIRRDIPGEEGFAWRLSMASVVEDGPFSNFSGYDRTLVLLEGAGMTLSYADNNASSDVLDHAFQMAQFEGERSTHAKLHNGTIRDFNIMTRSDLYRAQTTCGGNRSSSNITTSAETLLVFAATGGLNIEDHQNKTLTAPAGSLVVFEPPTEGLYTITADAFIAVEVFKIQA